MDRCSCQEKRAVGTVIAELPALTGTTLRLAGVEAAKWLVTGRSETIEGRMREFDTGSLAFADHLLLPRSGCPHCRGLAASRVELRAVLSPLTGVAARVEVVREWPSVAVYTGEGSQKLAVDGKGGAYHYSPENTFGVAETAVEAATVCLAEAVERFSARFQGDERIVAASLEQLGPRAVSPSALLFAIDEGDPHAVTGWVESMLAW